MYRLRITYVLIWPLYKSVYGLRNWRRYIRTPVRHVYTKNRPRNSFRSSTDGYFLAFADWRFCRKASLSLSLLGPSFESRSCLVKVKVEAGSKRGLSLLLSTAIKQTSREDKERIACVPLSNRLCFETWCLGRLNKLIRTTKT